MVSTYTPGCSCLQAFATLGGRSERRQYWLQDRAILCVWAKSPNRWRIALRAAGVLTRAPRLAGHHGHATIAITLDTYSHAIPAMQEEAAALIAGLVFAGE